MDEIAVVCLALIGPGSILLICYLGPRFLYYVLWDRTTGLSLVSSTQHDPDSMLTENDRETTSLASTIARGRFENGRRLVMAPSQTVSEH